MRVSVVIPVYNRSVKLVRALDSVFAQRVGADEVIVVDDGSDIETEKLVGSQFPRALYLSQPHSGVSRARNYGVSQARSDWIAFLDSDDEWHPEKLAIQTVRIKQTGMLVSHTNEIWIRNGVRVNPHNKHKKSGGHIFSKCLHRCLISPSSVIVNKSFLERTGGFDEALPACEDYDLWLRIALETAIDYIEKPLITKYGGHTDQLSQKYWGMDRFRIYSLEKLYANDCLTTIQAVEVLSVLIEKCAILSKGAVKRHNLPLYAQYSEKTEKYTREHGMLMSLLDKSSV